MSRSIQDLFSAVGSTLTSRPAPRSPTDKNDDKEGQSTTPPATVPQRKDLEAPGLLLGAIDSRESQDVARPSYQQLEERLARLEKQMTLDSQAVQLRLRKLECPGDAEETLSEDESADEWERNMHEKIARGGELTEFEREMMDRNEELKRGRDSCRRMLEAKEADFSRWLVGGYYRSILTEEQIMRFSGLSDGETLDEDAAEHAEEMFRAVHRSGGVLPPWLRREEGRDEDELGDKKEEKMAPQTQ